MVFVDAKTFHFFGTYVKNKGVFGNPKHSFIYCRLQLNCSSVAEAMRSTTCF